MTGLGSTGFSLWLLVLARATETPQAEACAY